MKDPSNPVPDHHDECPEQGQQRSPIRMLSNETINQIAAGEVIENPASVIKELVDNSLDAEANEIFIEVRAGGRQLILLADNGCGISKEDLALAFERHATSKIQELDDLDRLSSRGFRGEALASIAAVARCSITSCQDGVKAFSLEKEGEGQGTVQPAARTQGSTLEVRDLFFNVPVRRKFQKSVSADNRSIQKMCVSLALANPEVRFTLKNEDKVTLKTGGGQGNSFSEIFLSASKEILGREIAQKLIPIDFTEGPYRICGVIGSPDIARPSRSSQFFFVNRCPIQSPFLAMAVREGYATRLEEKRYPVFAIHLFCDPDLVDFNIHPRKSEVRFLQDQTLRKTMVEAISTAWLSQPVTPSYQQEVKQEEEGFPEPEWSSPKTLLERPSAPLSDSPFEIRLSADSKKDFPDLLESCKPQHFQTEAPPKVMPLKMEDASSEEAKIVALDEGVVFLRHPSSARALGDETGDVLLALNIQRTKFRVFYDQALRKEKGSDVLSQGLLLPQTLELGPTEALELESCQEELEALGFGIRLFGEHTYLIEAVPQSCSTQDPGQIVLEVLSTLRTLQRQSTRSGETETGRAFAAAQALSSHRGTLCQEEAITLFRALCKCSEPLRCPAGKVTLIALSAKTIFRSGVFG